MSILLGGKVLVGVDIGSTSIKVIELTKMRKKVTVTGFGMAYVKKNLNEAIIEAFEQGGIDSRKVATAISGRSDTVIKYLTLPEVQNEELKIVMQGELDKYIPWDIDDCYFDCQRMKSTDEEQKAKKMKVLMVASKKNIINNHHAMLNTAGLKSKIIDVEAFALGNAYELALRQNESIAEDVVALIDVGATKTNINIMSGTESNFVREIYTAGDDITNAISKKFGAKPEDIEKMKRDPGETLDPMLEVAAPILEEISNDIKLSFDYFENQFDRQVRKVLLSGGTIRLPGIVDLFSQQINIPCTVWDPTEDLDIDGSKVDVKKLKDNSMVIATALGLASRIK